MTAILIADDHEVVRSGLRSILAARTEWDVVGEAVDGKDAIRKAIELKPDVAVLEFALPLVNGIEATRQICARVPTVEVLIFTRHNNENLIYDVLEAGARGYLLKSDATHSLLMAIESLSMHRPFFTAVVYETLLGSYLTKPGPAEEVLSPREHGVVQLIAEGNSNKQIGKILNISRKTVETHRAAAMRKLQLSSPAALVRYAVRNLIVEA
jgi:DNA-binding NarL/FixJ family response regulator